MKLKTQIWYGVTGVFCALIVLFGFTGVLAPQLNSARIVHDETESVNMIAEAQDMQLAVLKAADGNELRGELLELEVAIPTDPQWAAFLQELQSFQELSGAQVQAVTVDPITVPVVEDPTAEEVVENVTSDENIDAVDQGTEVSDETAAMLPLRVTVQLSGESQSITEFARMLQTAQRLFVMEEFSIDESNLSQPGTLIGNIYIAQ